MRLFTLIFSAEQFENERQSFVLPLHIHRLINDLLVIYFPIYFRWAYKRCYRLRQNRTVNLLLSFFIIFSFSCLLELVAAVAVVVAVAIFIFLFFSAANLILNRIECCRCWCCCCYSSSKYSYSMHAMAFSIAITTAMLVTLGRSDKML